jgi:hypothetical protein
MPARPVLGCEIEISEGFTVAPEVVYSPTMLGKCHRSRQRLSPRARR